MAHLCSSRSGGALDRGRVVVFYPILAPVFPPVLLRFLRLSRQPGALPLRRCTPALLPWVFHER